LHKAEKKHIKESANYDNFQNMKNELTKELSDELLTYSLCANIKNIGDENVYVIYILKNGIIDNEIFKAKTIAKLKKKFDLFKFGWSLGFKYSVENNGNTLTKVD